MARKRLFDKLSTSAKEGLLLTALDLAKALWTDKSKTDIYGIAVQCYPSVLRRKDFELIKGKSYDTIPDWREEIILLTKIV